MRPQTPKIAALVKESIGGVLAEKLMKNPPVKGGTKPPAKPVAPAKPKTPKTYVDSPDTKVRGVDPKKLVKDTKK
jgi:hypothetical protein